MKIATFVDHGPDMENSDRTRPVYAAYQKVAAAANHMVAKPGDQLPFKGMKVQILAAAGEAIKAPVSGGSAPNPLCASELEAPVDPTENAQSVGMLITFDNFRFLDLGDLTKRKEHALVCPNNLLGTVDLYLTSHHGPMKSNSKAMVHALHARVAIMNNGAHKGGIPGRVADRARFPGPARAAGSLHTAVEEARSTTWPTNSSPIWERRTKATTSACPPSPTELLRSPTSREQAAENLHEMRVCRANQPGRARERQ